MKVYIISSLYCLIFLWALLDPSFILLCEKPALDFGEGVRRKTSRVIIGSSLGLWSSLLDFFKQSPILRDIALQAFNADQMIESGNVSEADVVYVGYLIGSNAFANDLVGNKAVTIYVQCENFEVTQFSHQYIQSVDVSLGSSADVSAINYQYTPCWLTTSLSRDEDYPLQFPPDLFLSVEPEVWRSRSRFAAQISNHGAFPRRLLVDLLNQIGLVEQLGKWSRTSSAWPSFLHPNWKSNAYFFRQFRFVICPESQRSPSGGYLTEKIIMAHVSGAVPVFWGDTPTIQVFNPDRILFLDVHGPDDPKLPGEVEKLLKTVIQLEVNKSFRDVWFSRPILTSSAPAWVKSWVSNVSDLINNARLRRSGEY